MKKVKYGIVTIISAFFVIFCGFSVACELKGDLFDKSVLKKCELEFLQKPENVSNEVYSIEGNEYQYDCEMESLTEFKRYVNSVFQGFISNNYTFGYIWDWVYLGDFHTSYLKVLPSLDIEDYSAYDSTQYIFLYTKKPIEKLKERYGGRFMGHRRITLYIEDKPNENGKYEMNISVRCSDSNNKDGNYIYEKE